jgi:hypothetical protein
MLGDSSGTYSATAIAAGNSCGSRLTSVVREATPPADAPTKMLQGAMWVVTARIGHDGEAFNFRELPTPGTVLFVQRQVSRRVHSTGGW